MTKARRRIVRAALLLQIAGIEADLTGCNYRAMKLDLDMQLSGLTPSRRKAARRQAHRLISETGGLQKAADHLVPHPLQQELAGREPPIQPSLKQAPRCLVCRTRFGFKRAFSSEEDAQKVCERQHDPRLGVYACPAHASWHLGHRPDASPGMASRRSTTSQRREFHPVDTKLEPIIPKMLHKEFHVKPEMKLTLANRSLIVLYTASLLLIGCAAGVCWVHTPTTVLLLATAGGVFMMAHGITLGLLWFWLNARWTHSVLRRNNH